jgi:hypothetical protein
MGVIYAAALRTTRMNSVVAAIDAGAGAGKLKIGTAAMGTVLAVLPLSDPCGSVTGDVLTFSTITADASADNTGTAAAAIITDSDDNTIVSGLTVSTSGANINLNTVSIVAGANVSMSSGTLTHNTSGI